MATPPQIGHTLTSPPRIAGTSNPVRVELMPDPLYVSISAARKGDPGDPTTFEFVFTPESYGAVGNEIADDSEALQTCLTEASTDPRPATVLLTKAYRVATNLYTFGDVDIVGPGEVVLDSDLGDSPDGFKFWWNFGISAKGVDAAHWTGTFDAGIRLTSALTYVDGVSPATGMRLLNVHRGDGCKITPRIDMRDAGPCKVSAIGCYSDGAWGPTPDKTNFYIDPVVLASQTAALGGEGIGGNDIHGLTIRGYVHGVGDDVIGIHAGCTDADVDDFKGYSVDGRLYFSSSQGLKVGQNVHLERIADPDGNFVSGGALLMAEIENAAYGAPADIDIADGATLVHGEGTLGPSGTPQPTYGARLRGVRRTRVGRVNVYDEVTGGNYAVTWEGDSDSTTWTDPDGLDNWVQVIKKLRSPTGGTFTLTYAGVPTSAIAYDASAATVKTALEALPGIGAGNVSVTKNGTTQYTVTLGAAITTPTKIDVTPSVTGPGVDGNPPTMTSSVGARVHDLTVSDPVYYGPANGRGDGRIREAVGFTGAIAGPVRLSGIKPGPRWTNALAFYLTGDPTGGTFTLTYSGQTTSAIAYDADEATLQAALEALSNIAPGDVTVIASTVATSAWVIAFAPGFSVINALSANTSGLTGGTSPSARIAPRTGFSGTSAAAYETNNFPAGINLAAASTTGMQIGDVRKDVATGRLVVMDDAGAVVPFMLNRNTTKLTATTISNATSGTLWTDETIPAAVLRVGMAIRLVIPISFSCIASTGGTFEVQYQINGTTIGTGRLVNIAQTSAISNYKLEQAATIWVEALGASGTVSMSVVTKTRSNIGGTIIDENTHYLGQSIDLSPGLTPSALAVMTVANAGNQITAQRGYRLVL